MSGVPLQMSFSGGDLGALFSAVSVEPPFAEAKAPEWFLLDGKQQEGKPVPPPAKVKRSLFVHLGDGHFVSLDVGAVVKAAAPGWSARAEALVELIDKLPCELASARGIYTEWDDDPSSYPMNLGFGNLHHPFGSFAAFKGQGHDRLVSRRWLEHGPWKLHRGRGDVSVIQFHDLAADPRTAYAQAKRGWDHLGPSDAGGLFWPKFKRRLTLKTQYSARDRRAIIVVDNRQVTPLEMLELRSLVGEDAGAGRIDSVGFVYMDEAQARQDLHQVWLRGIECWIYLRGVETRIDQEYQPPAASPPW